MEIRQREKNPEKRLVVALAGNPNVGKSTIFNALTNLRQHTGNWTGKTVSAAVGYFETGSRVYELVDIPGMYSLVVQSQEEAVARDYICGGEADVIVAVCDATCLERNLNLVLQIMEVTSDVLLCLNLMDEAKKKGIVIDREKLEDQLQIPVISVTARNKKSLRGLTEQLDSFRSERKAVQEQGGQQKVCEERCISNQVTRAEEICRNCVSHDKKDYHEADRRADRILTGRLAGYPIMAALLALILWITITGANYPSQILSQALFWVQNQLTTFFQYIDAPKWLYEMLVLGVYRVVAWVVAVMLPPMAIFFPLFTILEDSGYLPRIAYNLDKPFQCCGACGKQALTMAMGFGCNAVGVTGCRIIDSKRERLIAILTNNFVPCNGRLPMLITMIGILGAGTGSAKTSLGAALLLTGFILFGIMTTFVVSKLLSQTVLKGVPSSFTLELPPYRKPQFGKVILRSVFDRTLFVLGRAISAAAPAGLIIWLLANIRITDVSILTECAGLIDPVAKIFGLDGFILIAFLLGMPANEIVLPIILMMYMGQGSLAELSGIVATKEILLANGWNAGRAVCVMIFSLMHWPCATTLMTIKKETGSIKWTAAAFCIPTLMGLLACFLVNCLVQI